MNTYSQTLQECNDSVYYYYKELRYREAIPFAQKAVKLSEKQFGKFDTIYAKSLFSLGGLYFNCFDYEKAKPFYEQSLLLRKKILGETHITTLGTMEELGVLYSYNQEYKKALSVFDEYKRLVYIKLGKQSEDYSRALLYLIYLFESVGNTLEAFEIKREFVTLRLLRFKDDSPKPDATNMYLFQDQFDYLVKALNKLGKTSQVLNLYESLIFVYKKNEDNSSANKYTIELASILANNRNFLEAKQLLLRVIEGGKEKDINYANALTSLSEVYVNLGKNEQAEHTGAQAIETAMGLYGKKSINYALAINNLAALYYKMGYSFFDKADSLFKTAKQILKQYQKEYPAVVAQSIAMPVSVYLSNEKINSADSLVHEALSIFTNEKVENEEVIKSYLFELKANVCMKKYFFSDRKEKKYYNLSESFFLKSLEIRRHTGSEIQWILQGLGILYLYESEYEKATNIFLERTLSEIDVIKRQIYDLSDEKILNFAMTNFASTTVYSGASLIYNYPKVTSSFITALLNLELKSSGNVLAGVKKRLSHIRSLKDTSVLNLFEKWIFLKNEVGKTTRQKGKNTQVYLQSLNRILDSVEYVLNKKTKIVEKISIETDADVYKMLESLNKDQVAVQFIRFQLFNKSWTDSTMYAAYILNKKDSTPIFVPLFEEKQLQKLIDSANRIATSTANIFYRNIVFDDEVNGSVRLGKEIFQLIWRPLLPYLKNVKQISYSPAGLLYGIAHHALPVDSTATLMDKYELQQYTSTRQVALRGKEDKSTKPLNITLFGDADFSMDSLQIVKQRKDSASYSNIYLPPNRAERDGAWPELPGTAKEVNDIKAQFEKNKITTQSYLKKTATEENLKALSGKSPQVLHIATHGFFLPNAEKKRKENAFISDNAYSLAEDPLLRTGLILSGGNYAWSGKTPIDGVEDGVVTAYEIAQLDLSNTELVVLSACETALGDVKGNEGVFGMQRAFKMAGVKKMIVSLWKVPDAETAELMTLFYQNWLASNNINNAFAEAQSTMRKKYPNDPYKWAAFVLVE